MNFKEKKAFYKDRQVFFDAVKKVREGEEPEIEYEGQKYTLFQPENFWDYVDEVRHGRAVIYSKKEKKNILIIWNYSTKGGFCWYTESNKYVRDQGKRILCFAKPISNE